GTLTGTYTWKAAYGGDSNNNSGNDQGGSTEQVVVSAASPAITTTPNPTSVTLGTTSTTLNDSAVFSGGYHPTGTITFTLLSPSSTVVYTDMVTVSGNGTYTTAAGNNPGGYTLPSTGTVTGT